LSARTALILRGRGHHRGVWVVDFLSEQAYNPLVMVPREG
jgi:hypothetical protein